MNKQEYITQLESGLSTVTPDERVAALQYYTEYFDDAGVENEQQVIEELGPPDKLAADIRAASGAEESWTPPAKPAFNAQAANTGTGPMGEAQLPPGNIYGAESTGHTQQAQPTGQNQHGNTAHTPPQAPKRSGGATALLIIVLILFSPAILGVGGGLLGALFGLFVAAAVICFVPLIVGVAFIGTGIAGLFGSTVLLPFTLGSSLLAMGIMLILIGVGVLLCWFGITVLRKFIPAVIRGFVNAVRSIFYSIKGATSNG